MKVKDMIEGLSKLPFEAEVFFLVTEDMTPDYLYTADNIVEVIDGDIIIETNPADVNKDM